MRGMKWLWTFFLFFMGSDFATAQFASPRTYCNPVDIDYTYMIYNAHNNISYRSGADPAVVRFRNEYYMFVTRSMGYWHSTDLLNWDFIEPEKWYFQGSNAPAAFNYKDSVLYMTGDPSGSMSILFTDDPKKGNWKATPSILNQLQDPALFIDDDGAAYMYWGSSNRFPIRARKLNRELRFKPSDSTYSLFNLDPSAHGWERFGHNHSDTLLSGYIEGPWMNKINGKYYLQYAAPGTEFNVYGDGVYIGENPLGPFRYAPNNPFCYKPGGFINGAGHGSTVLAADRNAWHFSSMAVAVNVGWERRIAMFPTWFSEEGLMFSDTRFGDYPHFAPGTTQQGHFTGWMLLSYNKPVTVSSAVKDHEGMHAADENVKTFWLAEKNDSTQWMMIDLEESATIHAIQINFHDHQSGMFGRIPDLFHRYLVQASADGSNWETIVNKESSFRDAPNAYVELPQPKLARYVRYRNLHVPTPHLAISGFRIFGKGGGKAPATVKNFSVNRKSDRRDATIQWDTVPGAQGYNVMWGIAPDQMHNSWMVYGENRLELKALSTDQTYFFSIEAFSGNGVSKPAAVLKAE